MADMAYIRELLATPDAGNFRDILAQLEECTDLEEKTTVIQYAERHLADWPDADRMGTAFDVVPYTGDCADPDMSHLSLVRTLDLRPDTHTREAGVDLDNTHALPWYLTPHLAGVTSLDLRGLSLQIYHIRRIRKEAAFVSLKELRHDSGPNLLWSIMGYNFSVCIERLYISGRLAYRILEDDVMSTFARVAERPSLKQIHIEVGANDRYPIEGIQRLANLRSFDKLQFVEVTSSGEALCRVSRKR